MLADTGRVIFVVAAGNENQVGTNDRFPQRWGIRIDSEFHEGRHIPEILIVGGFQHLPRDNFGLRVSDAKGGSNGGYPDMVYAPWYFRCAKAKDTGLNVEQGSSGCKA